MKLLVAAAFLFMVMGVALAQTPPPCTEGTAERIARCLEIQERMKASAAAQEAAIRNRERADAQAAKQREEEAEARRQRCAQLPESERALVAKGSIAIGMSEAALLCSWPSPTAINRTVLPNSVHKQYVYPNAYVYVENGKIVSWQD